MKVKLAKDAIAAYSDALKVVGADTAAADLDALGKLFYGFSSKDMELLLSHVKAASPSTLPSESSEVRRVRHLLDSLVNLLRSAGAGRRTQDLRALCDALKRHESCRLNELISAVQSSRHGLNKRSDMISPENRDFAAKLKDALGREKRFNNLYAQLEQKGTESIAQITKLIMSGGSTKSKRSNLARILSRHEALISSLAKQRSNVGRTAA